MFDGLATYFESSVLSAEPVELVRMLYRGAVEAVEKAREHLREGDIAARSAQITRAAAIIAHLTFSVDRNADPALGGNLVELYDYMQRRLLRGNLEQADSPLAEVSKLLSALLEAWTECGPAEQPATQAAAPEPAMAEGYAGSKRVPDGYAGIYAETTPVMAGVYGDAEPAAECPGQGWSF